MTSELKIPIVGIYIAPSPSHNSPWFCHRGTPSRTPVIQGRVARFTSSETIKHIEESYPTFMCSAFSQPADILPEWKAVALNRDRFFT